VTLTDRDKKIALFVLPVIVLVAYWFLLLAPKRHEASAASEQAQKQEQKRDQAKARLQTLEASKTSFAGDYAQMVRLGKAVPTSVDMPSLMVQLQSAAQGTGISFTKIQTGDRQQASSTSSSATSTSGSSASGSKPTAAGGASAQSAPGTAVESANNAKQNADQKTAAAEKSGASPSDTQTSTSSGSGLPVGGGAAAAGGGQAASSGVPGLDTVPLNLEFQGNFLKLADFFHRLKRFVRVVNQRVSVHGRLMTVEGLSFSTDAELFPKVKAELTATVYLSPASEGKRAGATPQGPSGASPAGGTTPAGSTSPSPTPTATATP
jgi:Tfp pilus assembly protein PilO